MRKFSILAIALVLAIAMSISVSARERASTINRQRVVKIVGDEQFIPNRLIRSDFRFAPGLIRVKSGSQVTWQNTTEDEHTITVVEESDVPEDFDEVFECRDPGGPCRAALDAHFATVPPTAVINVGASGLDAAGDSLLVPGDDSINAVISAPAGTSLSYICAVHPWMQGNITVV